MMSMKTEQKERIKKLINQIEKREIELVECEYYGEKENQCCVIGGLALDDKVLKGLLHLENGEPIESLTSTTYQELLNHTGLNRKELIELQEINDRHINSPSVVELLKDIIKEV
jgi:sulfur carrier protein ThiS